MEIQNILIFAFVGALCMMIIAGGAVSMMGDDTPSQTSLAGGAVLGGVLGAAVPWFTGADAGEIAAQIGGGQADMKVGLPNF